MSGPPKIHTIDFDLIWDKIARKEPHATGCCNYPPLHVVGPLSGEHKNTIILLHGTSTDGPSFASSLLHFKFPSVLLYSMGVFETSLPQRFPHTRFIFPTGAPRETTVFGGKVTNAWFDIHDFSDRTIGEHESATGMRESFHFLSKLVEWEYERLRRVIDIENRHDDNGKKEVPKVVIGGFSQGAAMALICALSRDENINLARACCCLSGWLPFRRQILEAMEEYALKGEGWKAYSKKVGEAAANTILGMLGAPKGPRMFGTDDGIEYLRGNFFLAHGMADEKVKYEWGVEARDVVMSLGADYMFRDPPGSPFGVPKKNELKVKWVSEEGLGHWYGAKEMQKFVEYLEQPEILG
ncbi:hypothetical protein HYFRA_00004026 [Hymenoscyphus fraxineus]|uniref:Phospholipase/carboxylesterase/thioesterase domain-containing protein n=1 Tax=Hymenoscyphus fraxineus TaxID=746836 RepID=A0A9N9KN29_9HELO|nr:hypothetical protein HYFRA_00004026 [Hymenoscyphus fraxineus]